MSEILKLLQKGGTLLNSKSAPKNWMVNYMDSDIYKERLTGMGNKPITKEHRRDILNTNIVSTDFNGTKLIRKNEVNFVTLPGIRSLYGIKEGLLKRDVPNILIHPDIENEINKSYQVEDKSLVGFKAPKDVIAAHELSHDQRSLNDRENTFVNSITRKDTYKNSHDELPDEQKADLDALRYQMFKKNIYDTSKRNMTLEDFNKAKSDKDISNNFNFQRLIKSFTPENIVKFNNIIAANKNELIPTARLGLVLFPKQKFV